jgi:site-specific DNA recombinase
MGLRLDGYVRVSRVGGRDHTDGFISPDIQERAIRDWAGRNGAHITVQPHELNVSGGTMNRPIFNEIMDRIRSGQTDGIVVYKLDRFARTLLGALNTLEDVGRHGATFASATEPELDYTTPSGRAFVQQLFVFAELTRSSLKESWAGVQRHAIERGIHISPVGFLGYDIGDGRRLKPNAQAELVAEAFRQRGAGETWGMIADYLNKQAPRTDGTVWTPQAVQRMCAKRVYRGEASRYVVQDRDGRGAVVNRDAHPAIVTEDEWQAAQMNPRIAKGGSHGEPLPLLANMIRCAGCRYSMSLGYAPTKEPMYRCRRKHASGTCPEPAQIMASAVEAHVEDQILSEIDGTANLVVDDADRERVMEELTHAREDTAEFKRDTKARRKLGAEWHEWLDNYLAAERQIEAELATVEQRLNVTRDGLTRDAYADLSISERREVISGFVDTIMVRPSRGRGRHVDPIERRLRILWRGQGPTDLPRRRVVNTIVSFEFEDDVEAGVAAA